MNFSVHFIFGVQMENKINKSSIPKKIRERKDLCFKNEAWYEQTYKKMAISLRKPPEMRFNFVPPTMGRLGSE
jgi:hypothetical protein